MFHFLVCETELPYSRVVARGPYCSGFKYLVEGIPYEADALLSDIACSNGVFICRDD